MKNHQPRRIYTQSSQFLWALLMLCLIVQPVIAYEGALHEVIGHAGSLESYTDLHTTQRQADSTETGGKSNASHQLMHHTHCCAQPQLPALVQWQLLAFKPAAKMHWEPTNANVDDGHAALPFRPPIQA